MAHLPESRMGSAPARHSCPEAMPAVPQAAAAVVPALVAPLAAAPVVPLAARLVAPSVAAIAPASIVSGSETGLVAPGRAARFAPPERSVASQVVPAPPLAQVRIVPVAAPPV